MDSIDWFNAVVGGDTRNSVAERSGVYAATLNKQLSRGGLSPEVVVAVGRAYGAPLLDGLVACGLITRAEAAITDPLGRMDALREASDEELLRELLRRVSVDRGEHPLLTMDLDSAALDSIDGSSTVE